MDCSMLDFPIHHQLVELVQTHGHQVSDAIQPSHPLSSPSLPAFDLSQHQGHFQWVGSSHQVAKDLELQLQHQSLQWIFRIDWFDLLSVKGTLKSLLQHHSSKASILWCSAFFVVQLLKRVQHKPLSTPHARMHTYTSPSCGGIFSLPSSLVISHFRARRNPVGNWRDLMRSS